MTVYGQSWLPALAPGNYRSLLSVFIDWLLPEILCIYDQAYITKHSVFKVQTCWSTLSVVSFFLSYGICNILFINSTIEGHLDCFLILPIQHGNVTNIHVHVFVQKYVFLSPGEMIWYLRGETLGYMLISYSTFNNYPNVFQSGCPIWHSHQQSTRVPVTPHPLSTLGIVGFFLL